MSGPNKMFLPAFPKVKAAGWANAARLKYWWIVGFGRPGFPTMLGYQLPESAPLRFTVPIVGVYGLPDSIVKIDDACQPPRNASTIALVFKNCLPFPKGSW